MSYLSERFPDNIAREPVGGPSWSTGIVATLVGDEQRNQNWTSSRHSYDFSHGTKTDADFRVIGAHFRMARGRLHHFRVKDFADFQCARADGALTLLTSTTFQLGKNYGAVTAFTELRRITRPVSGTVQIWKNGVAQVLTTNFTVAIETGIVTFLVAPGAATLEAAFEFDVPCRYDTDKLEARLVHYAENGGRKFHAWESVPVLEVRE